MRILKKIFLLLLSSGLLILFIALFINGEIKVEKSININTTAETVWSHVNTLEGMNSWNPIISKDPDMRTIINGIDGKPGSRFCWNSTHKEVGKGCQTITSVTPEAYIETDIQIFSSFRKEARASVKLQPTGNTTKVTWSYTSEIPYPRRILKIFMSPEEEIGRNYTVGLQRLKALSER